MINSIPGYNGKYFADSYGNIFNLKKKLKPQTTTSGYLRVSLYLNGIQNNIEIHRLMGITFLQRGKNDECINHINGIKTDNTLKNLERCTIKENNQHARSIGLHKTIARAWKGKYGKDHNTSKGIYQLDINGNFIKEWGSSMDIKRELGLDTGSISKCCTGKSQQAYGYKWVHKDQCQGVYGIKK